MRHQRGVLKHLEDSGLVVEKGHRVVEQSARGVKGRSLRCLCAFGEADDGQLMADDIVEKCRVFRTLECHGKSSERWQVSACGQMNRTQLHVPGQVGEC